VEIGAVQAELIRQGADLGSRGHEDAAAVEA
jgi:hypothetical protein